MQKKKTLTFFFFLTLITGGFGILLNFVPKASLT